MPPPGKLSDVNNLHQTSISEVIVRKHREGEGRRANRTNITINHNWFSRPSRYGKNPLLYIEIRIFFTIPSEILPPSLAMNESDECHLIIVDEVSSWAFYPTKKNLDRYQYYFMFLIHICIRCAGCWFWSNNPNCFLISGLIGWSDRSENILDFPRQTYRISSTNYSILEIWLLFFLADNF